MKTTLFQTLHFSAVTKTTDTLKNKRCCMTLEELSSVCAKLETAASSKNNEILEINVLQKFTSHALFYSGRFFYRAVTLCKKL